MTVNVPRERRSNTLAVLLNIFCWPGVGQLTQGRFFAGMFWALGFLASVFSILLIIGFFLTPIFYIGALIDAAIYRGR